MKISQFYPSIILKHQYPVLTYFQDNPADFSFFFDTSRRRTCYIAPERFLEGSIRQTESYTVDNPEGLQETGNILKGELTPAMDIFSAG